MRNGPLILAGALLVGGIVYWKLRDPPVGSCTARVVSEAVAPGERDVARVVDQVCSEGLRSGVFVKIENTSEPGVQSEAFYSTRDLGGVSLTWLSDRELLIETGVAPTDEERQYSRGTHGRGVKIQLRQKTAGRTT